MDTHSNTPPAGSAKSRGPRARRLADLFTLVENGRLKSTLLLYSFSMGFVVFAVYAAAYALLLKPLDALFSGRMPAPLANWLEAAVPAMIGTAVCLLLQARIRERRMVPLAFMWLAFLVIPTLGGVLAMLEPADRQLYFGIAAPVTLLPLGIGAASSLWLYFRKTAAFAAPGRDERKTNDPE